MKQILKILAFTLLIIGFSSCGKDKVSCNNFEQIIANEFTQIFTAALAYGFDPTPANCNNYKNVLNDYLDVLEDYKHCGATASERDELELEIDQTRDDLQDLEC